MNLEIKLDGKSVVNLEIDVHSLMLIAKTLTQEPPPLSESRSTPLSVTQARELLANIDPKSKAFLLKLAKQGGKLTWGEMRKIFELDDDAGWSSYTRAWGKGITKAVRYILKDKQARLIWSVDEEWEDDCDPLGPVYVDGVALESLKSLLT
jgi:hypothetical protein